MARKRPVFVESEYSKEYRSQTGEIAPSDKIVYGHFRSSLKYYLLSLRGNTCERCKTTWSSQKEAHIETQVHHIVKVSDSGTDEDDNLMILCHSCHRNEHGYHIPHDSRSSYKF